MVRTFPKPIGPTNTFHVEARKVSSTAVHAKASDAVEVKGPQVILAGAILSIYPTRKGSLLGESRLVGLNNTTSYEAIWYAIILAGVQAVDSRGSRVTWHKLIKIAMHNC